MKHDGQRRPARQTNYGILKKLSMLIAAMAMASIGAAQTCQPPFHEECNNCSYTPPPPPIGGQIYYYDQNWVPLHLCHTGPCHPFTC